MRRKRGADEEEEGEEEEEGYPTLSHGEFVMKLAEQLIDGYSEGFRVSRQQKSKQVRTHKVKHGSVRMDGKWSKHCANCKRKGKKSRKGKGNSLKKTFYGCEACGIYLCRGLCFRDYHGKGEASAEEDSAEVSDEVREEGGSPMSTTSDKSGDK